MGKASTRASAEGATHEPAAGVAWQRPGESPGLAADGLSASPRSVAQRERLAAAFGNARLQPEAVQGEAAPVQRISVPEARDKLGVPVGEDEVVAMLIQLHSAMDAIPALETILGGYADFLLQFPSPRLTRHEPLPGRKEVSYNMGGAITFLTRSLPMLLEVLGEVEDWYLQASPQDRGPEARKRFGEASQLANTLAGGNLVQNLLKSKPASMADVTGHPGRAQLTALHWEISQWFGGGGGGFSAVGRATEIKTDIQDVDPEASELPDSDESFIGGYYSGGSARNSLADSSTVVKAPHELAGGGPVMVAGRPINDPKAVAPPQRDQLLQQTKAGMTPLIEGGAQREFLRTPPAPRDRGKGQLAGMNHTNANGYAWLTDTPGWDKHPWEWLHIRAASLGGATDGTNLVLGTKDANTLMMPFEANIRLLAGIVRDHPHLEWLDVEWWTEDGQGHQPKTLRIKWIVEPTDKAPETVDKLADEASGEIVVANLYTDTHLSKDEVRLIEQNLSDFRKTLAPPET